MSAEYKKRGLRRTFFKNSSGPQLLVTLHRPLPVMSSFLPGASICSRTVTRLPACTAAPAANSPAAPAPMMIQSSMAYPSRTTTVRCATFSASFASGKPSGTASAKTRRSFVPEAAFEKSASTADQNIREMCSRPDRTAHQTPATLLAGGELPRFSAMQYFRPTRKSASAHEVRAATQAAGLRLLYHQSPCATTVFPQLPRQPAAICQTLL